MAAPLVCAAGQNPAHRRAGQAERPADHRLAVPGGGGRRDRLITLLPGGAGAAGPQRAAVPFGQAAPDAVHDPVAEGVVKARLADRAPRADPPRRRGALAAAGEEQVEVSAAARSPVTPAAWGRGWRNRGTVTRRGNPRPPLGGQPGQVGHVQAAGRELIREPSREPAGGLPGTRAHHGVRQRPGDRELPHRLSGDAQPPGELRGGQEVRGLFCAGRLGLPWERDKRHS
jgi:hypothetical protein